MNKDTYNLKVNKNQYETDAREKREGKNRKYRKEIDE